MNNNFLSNCQVFILTLIRRIDRNPPLTSGFITFSSKISITNNEDHLVIENAAYNQKKSFSPSTISGIHLNKLLLQKVHDHHSVAKIFP